MSVGDADEARSIFLIGLVIGAVVASVATAMIDQMQVAELCAAVGDELGVECKGDALHCECADASGFVRLPRGAR